MTAAELTAWLKLPASEEARVAEAMARALGAIEHAVDWYFGPPRQTSEIVSARAGTVYLRQPPVAGYPISVSSRYTRSDPWETVESADYEVEGRKLTHVSCWPLTERGIRVVYHEGFETLPSDVELRVIELVSNSMRQRGKEALKSESISDYSYTLADLAETSGWSQFVSRWKRGRI